MYQDKSVANLLAEGYLQLEKGQYEKALEIFHQLNNLAPDNPQAKYVLGLTYFRQQQYQQSIKYFNIALQLQPNYLLVLIHRGIAYKILEQNELANADIEIVLQAEPKAYKDWRVKAIALSVVEQFDKSLEYFDKALSIKPDDYESWFYKGVTCENLQHFDEAVKCYKTVLEIFPSKIFALVNLGKILGSLKQYTEALDCFDKALTLKENDSICLLWRGIALNSLKQFQDALNNFDLALSIYRDDCLLWYCKGQTLIELQRNDEAVYCLEKALEINPDFQAAREEKDKLLINQKESSSAYLKLIQELLQCPNSQENLLLSANQHLIDSELIEIMFQVAANLDREGKSNGKRLRNIAEYLNTLIDNSKPPSKYFHLLKEILQVFAVGGGRHQVYVILSRNIDKLNINFGKALSFWAIKIYPTYTKQKKLSVADVVIDLSSYVLEFPHGNKSDNIEIAILGYQTIISLFSKQEFPRKWAIAQNNISFAYGNRKIGDTKENFELAIDACKSALEVYTEGKFPIDWAILQNNLAVIYWYRIKGDKKENIELAIALLKNALKIRTEHEYPQEWAETQNNLGLTYLSRIQGDRKENIELAITFFKNALRIRTEHKLHIRLAETQNNLGNIYLARIAGDRKENIEIAIDYYIKALEVYTESEFPYMWAGVNTNLGLAYGYRLKGNELENTELSISALKSALKVRTKDNLPFDWAETQTNLSLTYLSHPKENEKRKNIELAITICNNALEIYTKTGVPLRWAKIQHNLGYAYSIRNIGNKEDNIQKATAAYNAALTVYTPQKNPIDYLKTARNLGNFAFEQGDWQSAIKAYSNAIKAIETSRSWSIDDNRRQEIIVESIAIYENTVQACINNGQLEQAIEYAERSRCRRLVDLMASNDFYSNNNIPKEVAEYLKEYESLQKRIDEEVNRNSINNNYGNTKGASVGSSISSISSVSRTEVHAQNYEIGQLETKKQQVWQKIRSYDRILSEQIQVNPIPFDDIRKLIPDSQTVLIYCYTTQTKLQIFVIFKDKPVELQITEFDIQKLHKFANYSWFAPYLKDFEVWKEQMPQNLVKLADNLNIFELVQNHLQDIEELIIIPHLYLHYIPFSALPINSPSQERLENNFQELLGERFRLRILPSAQVLQFCHQRDSEPISTVDYGIIENADNSLPCSQYEGEKIAQIFNIPDTNRLRGKTQATVKNYRQLVERVQVLHSSHHASSRLDNPLESCLELADGKISLGSIMSPGWRLPNIEDIFLSCCETNLGRTELSDDPLTIATGFLCAGARNVVSTLWKVDDLATAIFSIIYYQLSKDGLDRPTALQQAQYQLKNLTGEELKQRFYPQMYSYLQTQQELAREKYRQSSSQLQHLTKETLEYKQIEVEKNEWYQINQKFGSSKALLKKILEQSSPFSHPYYWAGFTSQGLR